MAYTQPPVSIAEAYRVLGVQNGESLEVIRTAYKRLALTTHPDKNPGNEEATQQFQRISEAYHVLATYLDKSTHRREYADPFGAYDGRNGYDDDDDDGGYVYFDLEGLSFYLFMYQEILGGGRRRFHMGHSFFCPHRSHDNRDHRSYVPNSRRSQRSNGEAGFHPDYSWDTSAPPEETPEQAAARRTEENARAKERMKQQRENEMKDAATRKKEKAERKRERAKQDRQSAAKVLASQQEKMQVLRSKVFAAARNGDADAVKKGVWEQDVDPSGGEIKPGCDHLVRQKPKDTKETLLHIASRFGDKDLLEWLASHSGDMEERTSEGHTAFHIALKRGHVPVLKYFFETYSTKDEDTRGIYSLPGPSSLLCLAIESLVPEAVWMILDKKLYQRKEIVDAWKNLSSPIGTPAFINSIEQQNVKGTTKQKEILDEVMNLIANFGGFTRPPSPPIYTYSSDSMPPCEPSATSSGSRLGRDVPSQRQQAQTQRSERFDQLKPKRNASDQPASKARPEATQNTRSGRGRGRGRGRG